MPRKANTATPEEVVGDDGATAGLIGGKNHFITLVISPSCASSLVIPAAASVFCRLAISASEQMPECPTTVLAWKINCCAARNPPRPSVIEIIQRESSQADVPARRKKAIFSSCATCAGQVVAPFAGGCPNDPFDGKVKNAPPTVCPGKTPEKKIIVRKKARYPLTPFFCRQLPSYSIPLFVS